MAFTIILLSRPQKRAAHRGGLAVEIYYPRGLGVVALLDWIIINPLTFVHNQRVSIIDAPCWTSFCQETLRLLSRPVQHLERSGYLVTGVSQAAVVLPVSSVIRI